MGAEEVFVKFDHRHSFAFSHHALPLFFHFLFSCCTPTKWTPGRGLVMLSTDLVMGKLAGCEDDWRDAWKKATSDFWSHIEFSLFIEGSTMQLARRIVQSIWCHLGFFSVHPFNFAPLVWQSSRTIITYWLSGKAGRENIWLEVRAYGPSTARSVHPDQEPNIFPWGPTLLSQ